MNFNYWRYNLKVNKIKASQPSDGLWKAFERPLLILLNYYVVTKKRPHFLHIFDTVLKISTTKTNI